MASKAPARRRIVSGSVMWPARTSLYELMSASNFLLFVVVGGGSAGAAVGAVTFTVGGGVWGFAAAPFGLGAAEVVRVGPGREEGADLVDAVSIASPAPFGELI